MGKNKGEMKYHTLKESLKNDINREIRCRQRIN